MVRMRSGWFVALVTLSALGLGAAACKKNDDKTGAAPAAADKPTDKSEAKPGDKPADKMAAPVSAATNANADDLSLLPKDSELVMGINIAQLQQSALWKQFSPKLMDKIAGGLADFKAACGFDPLAALQSVSLGMKGIGGTAPEGAVVVHGPDKAKVMACLDKAKAEASKKGSDLTIDGDVFIVKDAKGVSTAFTFVNDNTVLGVIGANGTKAGVLDAAKGASALKTSQTFVDLYSKINTGDSMWLLLNGNSPVFSKMGAMGVKPKAIFGSINLTDGLTVEMRARFGTPDEAASLVAMAKGQINNPQVKAMFDKLDVGADGADIKVSVGMSNQKLQALIGMVGGMMGGMMGGAGGMGGPGGP